MALVMRVKSASKNEFLSGLGLTPDHPATNNLYAAMKVRRHFLDVAVLEVLILDRLRRLRHLIRDCEANAVY